MSADLNLPSHEELLRLGPEEIGGVILQLISRRPNSDDLVSMNEVLASSYFEGKRGQLLTRAMAEGWSWLIAEGLLIRDPDQPATWHFVSRRGKTLLNPATFRKYISDRALKKELLHPRIVERSWEAFSRGDFDSAVFAAFREVEIHVRTLGKFGSDKFGTGLMRAAFGKAGPLTPKEELEAEQQAISDLYSGAIGWFKNPRSHRMVGEIKMHTAVQLLMFASYLMEFAESRDGSAQTS